MVKPVTQSSGKLILSPPLLVAKRFKFVDRSAVDDPSGISKNCSKNQLVGRARPAEILEASLEHAEDLVQRAQYYNFSAYQSE